jgi:hypothetical protein
MDPAEPLYSLEHPPEFSGPVVGVWYYTGPENREEGDLLVFRQMVVGQSGWMLGPTTERSLTQSEFSRMLHRWEPFCIFLRNTSSDIHQSDSQFVVGEHYFFCGRTEQPSLWEGASAANLRCITTFTYNGEQEARCGPGRRLSFSPHVYCEGRWNVSDPWLYRPETANRILQSISRIAEVPSKFEEWARHEQGNMHR